MRHVDLGQYLDAWQPIKIGRCETGSVRRCYFRHVHCPIYGLRGLFLAVCHQQRWVTLSGKLLPGRAVRSAFKASLHFLVKLMRNVSQRQLWRRFLIAILTSFSYCAKLFQYVTINSNNNNNNNNKNNKNKSTKSFRSTFLRCLMFVIKTWPMAVKWQNFDDENTAVICTYSLWKFKALLWPWIVNLSLPVELGGVVGAAVVVDGIVVDLAEIRWRNDNEIVSYLHSTLLRHTCLVVI